ncbi:DUF2071 domain-containing protein [Cytobacillus depressus]|uniref:DUF2071 domain-containing protein n=1 Tax=Cytobacillus depressus TaxID=1602942 RepID=A0A6L3V416_9BACI|nr:DUF2071 domain-containing protein [Cytobacillus depressus]KAB2334776.1 DUF2071 domain-containing protein [Cytobacillus depressus]
MKLMKDFGHRPWQLPSKHWIMRQTWSNLFFTHWPIAPEILRPYIPQSLQIDTFNRYAWVGIILFVMEGIYPRGLNYKSILPSFPEINVRTYVQCDDKPGIYFLSIDVGDWASYTIAKRWFRLPYFSSHVSFQKEDQTFQFGSKRKGNSNSPITFNGKYIPLPKIFYPKKGTLDHWLTERYCLYSKDQRGNLYCGEIHHRPWPLQYAESEIHMNTLLSPFNIDLNEVKPISHYSKGVDSLIWNIKKVPSNTFVIT